MDSMTAVTETDGTREGKGKNALSMDIQSNEKYFRSMDQSEQLFPRLPDEITISLIVSKLPWRAFHILAAVSRTWRRAIRTHRVYDARIQSCSIDTLVVHRHSVNKELDRNGSSMKLTTLAVYCTRDKLCYHLPTIPGCHRGIPSLCRCLLLDGKIYVIGGALNNRISSSKVYVLDLAGASQWKECASMEQARRRFGCHVVGREVFVFGGTHDSTPVLGAEVYNLEVDVWSPVDVASLRIKRRSYTRRKSCPAQRKLL